MNENVDYVAKKPSKSTKFLWWCAGADEKILQYCSYSDHIKYLGIGGVVLATTFMAALSMGFALHTIFGVTNPKTGVFEGNWFVTLPISFIWGVIVFNLDRFIVSSTGKGDGESTISLSELGNATPRLLMAILLGLTISAPLETTIFDKEIQREWNLSMDQLAMNKKFEIEQIENGQNGNIKNDLVKIEKDFENQNSVYEAAKKEFTDQMQGRAGAGAGFGERSKKLEITMNDEKIKLDQIDSARMNLRKKLTGDNQGIKNKQDSVMIKIKQETPGFLDKILMLEKLSSHKKEVPHYDVATKTIIEGKFDEINGEAFWAVWLVRLLFMIIEIAPVILKLMLIKSPYDYMGENVNQILEAKQGISMNHVTDEEGKLTKYKENFNPKRIVAIVEHQNVKEEENAKEAITRFADKEKEEIAKNPDAFIKPDNS